LEGNGWLGPDEHCVRSSTPAFLLYRCFIADALHVNAYGALIIACGKRLFMSLLELDPARDLHPVDVIEHVANMNDWSFERTGDDEISISVIGNWTDYHVSFSWMEDFEALHLACAFDLKVPENRTLEVMRLLSLINAQILFGHFDPLEQEGSF